MTQAHASVEVTLTWSDDRHELVALLPGGGFREPTWEERVGINAYVRSAGYTDADAFRGCAEVVLTKVGGRFFVHADHRPAIVLKSGARRWFRKGVLHRDGAPAIERDGMQFWYRHGKQHRDDGPADLDLEDGSERWYQNDVDRTAEMRVLLSEIAVGGRVIERDRTNRFGVQHFRVVTLEGQAILKGRFPRGWIDWILANADRRFPEFAAAMRAKAMREGMAKVSLAAPAPHRDQVERRRARPVVV